MTELLVGLTLALHPLAIWGTARLLGVPTRYFVEIRNEPPSARWRKVVAVASGVVGHYLGVSAIIFIVLVVAGRMGPTTVVAQVQPGGPSEGVLLPGDRLLEADGVPLDSLDDLRERVLAATDGDVTLVIDRAGARQTLQVQPVEGRIGVALSGERRTVGVGQALAEALPYPAIKAGEILVGLANAVSGERAVQVVGPIGISRHLEQAEAAGWQLAFELAALLAVYLGLLLVALAVARIVRILASRRSGLPSLT